MYKKAIFLVAIATISLVLSSCFLLGPSKPTGLTATASYKSVTLNWQDNATNEDGYKISRSTNGTNFTVVKTLAQNVTSYTDSNLNAKTKYYYKVGAYNSLKLCKSS